MITLYTKDKNTTNEKTPLKIYISLAKNKRVETPINNQGAMAFCKASNIKARMAKRLMTSKTKASQCSRLMIMS